MKNFDRNLWECERFSVRRLIKNFPSIVKLQFGALSAIVANNRFHRTEAVDHSHLDSGLPRKLRRRSMVRCKRYLDILKHIEFD